MTRRRRRGVIPAGLTRMSPQPGRARPPAVFTRGRLRTRPPTVRRCCGCCVLLQSCCGCYGLSQSGCGMFWAVAGRSGDRFRGPQGRCRDLLRPVAACCGLLQPVGPSSRNLERPCGSRSGVPDSHARTRTRSLSRPGAAPPSRPAGLLYSESASGPGRLTGPARGLR